MASSSSHLIVIVASDKMQQRINEELQGEEAGVPVGASEQFGERGQQPGENRRAVGLEQIRVLYGKAVARKG